jgi:hypothetical protein
MTERWGQLRQFRFQWPALDAAFGAAAMRWAMVIVALGGLVWVASLLLAKKRSNKPQAANVGD